MEKSALAYWGWGDARPPPFTLVTITYKVGVYARAKRAYYFPYFISILYVFYVPNSNHTINSRWKQDYFTKKKTVLIWIWIQSDPLFTCKDPDPVLIFFLITLLFKLYTAIPLAQIVFYVLCSSTVVYVIRVILCEWLYGKFLLRGKCQDDSESYILCYNDCLERVLEMIKLYFCTVRTCTVHCTVYIFVSIVPWILKSV